MDICTTLFLPTVVTTAFLSTQATKQTVSSWGANPNIKLMAPLDKVVPFILDFVR